MDDRPTHLPRAIADLAVEQHGVLTRRQVIEAGYPARSLDKRVRSGHLVVVGRGVYRVAGAPLTWHGRLLGACLVLAGVASHRSAAHLLEVRSFGPGTPEITTARAVHSRREGLIVHRSRDLHKATLLTVQGIPTTAPARLAVDLGAVLLERDVEGAIHEMVRARMLTWNEVAVSVLRHSKQGRDGVGVARRIVERRAAGLVGDSVLESVILALLHDANVPTPTRQVEIHDEHGFVARVDLVWLGRGVIVEADSWAFHGDGDRRAFEEDRRKRNRLRALGYVVLEWTWRMCMDERARVLTELRRALAARPPGSFAPSGAVERPEGAQLHPKR